MNITLNQAKRYISPSGLIALLVSLHKREPDDEPISLKHILYHAGIEDAVFALQCLERKKYVLFLADMYEIEIFRFEVTFPNDTRLKNGIQTLRDFYTGKASRNDCTLAIINLARAWADLNGFLRSINQRPAGISKIEKVYIKHFCDNKKKPNTNNQEMSLEDSKELLEYLNAGLKTKKKFGKESGDTGSEWSDESPWVPEHLQD